MTTRYSIEEVNKHNKDGDTWIVVDGKVYDISSFMTAHPGGQAPLEDVSVAGQDVSRQFHMLHDASILNKLGKKFLIGELDQVPAETKPRIPVKLHPSSQPGPNSGGTAHLLPAERKKATFNVEKMTDVLYNGQASKRRFILHPTHATSHGYAKYDMSREELIEKHVTDFVKIHRPFTLENYRPQTQEVTWMSEAATNSGSLMPHYGLFVPTLVGQGSAMQIATWLPRALTFQIVGKLTVIEERSL